MQNDKSLKGLGAVLMVVIATLMAAGGAWGQDAYKILHVFKTSADGKAIANLVLDPAGNVYGETNSGGAFGHGTVFELTPNSDGTWMKKTLHNFDYTDGDVPTGVGLVRDAAGNLYGMTQGGGTTGNGTVFELSPNSDGTWTERVLHNFAGGSDGTDILGGLTFDSAGNLYGSSGYGGTGGWGIVFQLTPNSDGTWTEHVINNFNLGSIGGYPWGMSMVLDAAGNLYGTTTYGGDSGCDPRANGCYGLGVVFELTPNGDGTWTENVLHTFTGGEDGANPNCTLVFDAAGNLYGTAAEGGNRSYCNGYGCGVAFELIPNSNGTWTERVLHTFTGTRDGANPFAALIFDASGNLYGTAPGGGAAGYGVAYKLSPTGTGWKETVLHTFTSFGEYPYAGLIFDAAGNLYGSAWAGTNNGGLVFEITP